MSLFQLKIINSSGFSDDKVWIIAKGQDPDFTPPAPYKMEEAYFQFDANGQANFHHPTTLGMSSEPFARQLSAFPKDPANSGVYLMDVPKTNGGRIYFSLGKGVMFTVKEGFDSNQNPVSLTIADPSAALISDPNYALIFDKIEFAYTDKLYIDTTAVDFFCMPITLTPNSLTDNSETVGLSPARSTILKAFAKSLQGKQWPKLSLVYPVTNTVLRVVAPNISEDFDSHYLDAYLASIWNTYQNSQVKVDCAELKNCKTFTGQTVSGSPGPFRFRDDQAPSKFVDINQPTSNQAFGCAGGAFDAPNDTPSAVIIRELATGINVGLLPVTNAGSIPVLDKQFFLTNQGSFYTDNQHGDNPWYNLYSKILHSFGCKIYAFAFDDAAGQDSTLQVDNAPGAFVAINLKDMSGTVLPDPDHDDNKRYNITFSTGQNGSGSMVNPSDNQTHLIPKQQATTVNQVSSPFELTYSFPGADDITYKVVVALRAAYAPDGQILGINWDGSSGINIQMVLPG